jgi:type IV pilus assembly protein PilW
MYSLRNKSTLTRADGGFTLIEFLISMAIGLVIIFGVAASFLAVKRNTDAQQQLNQYSDDQRFAVTILTTVLQQAGYYPNPQGVDATVAFPVTATFTVAGQSIAATTTSTGDVIDFRYIGSVAGAATSDFVVGCDGIGNTSTVAELSIRNRIYISSTGELVCSINGQAPLSLVGGIRSWTLLFGVDTTGDQTVDRYFRFADIPTDSLTRIMVVRPTFLFANPFAGQPGQSDSLTVTRVISIMNR